LRSTSTGGGHKQSDRHIPGRSLDWGFHAKPTFASFLGRCGQKGQLNYFSLLLSLQLALLMLLLLVATAALAAAYHWY
jgi:hypothetical protein